MDVHAMALFVALPLIILGFLGVLILRASAPYRPGAQTRLAGLKVWGPTMFLSSVFLVSGLPKLYGSAVAVNAFERWGYNQELMWSVGAVEFLCALFLLVPELASLSAAALSVVMFGSLFTHLAVGEYALALVPLAILSGLSWVVWACWADLKRALSWGRDARLPTS